MCAYRKGTFDELSRIQERVQSLFEEVLLRSGVDDATAGPGAVFPGSWTPAVDLLETDRAFLLYAEVPGVDRDDIDLTVEGRRLELSGRRRPLDSELAFARLERSYGAFRRAFDLPSDVDPDGIEASLEYGVLRVLLPKRSPDAASHRVPISNEGGG